MRPLKEWREERDLSLRALAERSGVHFTSISEIEQGGRRPHAQTAAKLARALGIGLHDIEEFFDREREALPNDEALLLASPTPPSEKSAESHEELNEDMIQLMRSMAAYLVRMGRGEDVERLLREVLEDTEGR